MKNTIFFLFSLLLFLNLSVNAANDFVKGADISWLPEMEKESNFVFYNDNGEAQDCFQILKDHGINTIRLRTWVNPSMTDWINGHCSKYETIAMAVRAQSWGMKVMIDFHYSDTWADPSNQKKPDAWTTHTFSQLLDDVYNYTYDFMTALDSAGVTPEWVQVGNEIAQGLLFPDGKFDSGGWANMGQLINKGYDAVKAVSPSTKVVLHIDKGHDNNRFRWWFDNAKANGFKYDIIGLSYYPYWIDDTHPDYTKSIDGLAYNLKDMVSRYGKEVMVVETGGLDTEPQNTKDMLTAVINKLLEVPDNAGLGLIYWEPEASRNWGQYPLSAWGTGTKPAPTIAMDAFLTATGIENYSQTALNYKFNQQNNSIVFNEAGNQIELINLNGQIVQSVTNSKSMLINKLNPGVYIIKFKHSDTKKISAFKLTI